MVASARVRLGLSPVAAMTAATVAPPIDIGNVSGTATSCTQLPLRPGFELGLLLRVAALVLRDHRHRREQQHEAARDPQRRQRQPEHQQQRPARPDVARMATA